MDQKKNRDCYIPSIERRMWNFVDKIWNSISGRGSKEWTIIQSRIKEC